MYFETGSDSEFSVNLLLYDYPWDNNIAEKGVEEGTDFGKKSYEKSQE